MGLIEYIVESLWSVVVAADNSCALLDSDSQQRLPIDCQWRGNRGCYFPSAGLSVLSLGSVWGPGLGGVWTNSCPPFCGQVRSRSWLSGYTFSLILWPHFVVYGSYNSGSECGLWPLQQR